MYWLIIFWCSCHNNYLVYLSMVYMRIFVVGMSYYFGLVGSSAYDNYLSGMGCYFGLVGMSSSAYDNYLSDKDSFDKNFVALSGKNFVALTDTNSSATDKQLSATDKELSATDKELVEYPLTNH